MGDERRQHQRFDLEYTIQLISSQGDMVLTALTSNISDGGCRMPLPVECLPETGQDVQINLTIRRNDTGEVEMYTGKGNVIRHSKADAEGVSEVAMKFVAPMELRLQETGQAASEEF
jgi:hypothetical protein